MSTENKDLQKAIEKAINDTLPKAQGSLLQKRLAEADQFEEDLAAYKKFEKETIKQIASLQSKNEELEGKLKDINHREAEAKASKLENEQRAIDLDAKQRGMNMQLLQKELDLTKESKTEILELNKIVFQNRTVRESVTSLNTMPQMGTYISVKDEYGCSHQQWIPTGPPSDGKTQNKTTTEE